MQQLPNHAWEAVERWKEAIYVPDPLPLRKRIPHPTRRRVLYFTPASFYSGAEECLRGLVEQLVQFDFEQVAVVGVEGVLAERLRSAGCEVAAANFNLRTASRAAVEQVFDAIHPSILHANGTIGDVFLDVARERAVPVILHVRTAVFPDTIRLSGADHLVAVSAFAREQLFRAGIPPQKMSLIYEGVNVERFKAGCLNKQMCREKFYLPQNAFVALMIARLTRSKRHDLMIEAFAQLCASGVDGWLVFVGTFGDQVFFHEMQVKIHHLGIQDRVRWLPFQSDIRAIECAADVIALPSDFEALGQCTLEGMALEIPVIVSDSGGGRELVEHDISGLVMRGGDAGSLASSLERLAGNPVCRHRLSKNGRRRVSEQFSLRRHAEQMAHLFENYILK